MGQGGGVFVILYFFRDKRRQMVIRLNCWAEDWRLFPTHPNIGAKILKISRVFIWVARNTWILKLVGWKQGCFNGGNHIFASKLSPSQVISWRDLRSFASDHFTTWIRWQRWLSKLSDTWSTIFEAFKIAVMVRFEVQHQTKRNICPICLSTAEVQKKLI